MVSSILQNDVDNNFVVNFKFQMCAPKHEVLDKVQSKLPLLSRGELCSSSTSLQAHRLHVCYC